MTWQSIKVWNHFKVEKAKGSWCVVFMLRGTMMRFNGCLVAPAINKYAPAQLAQTTCDIYASKVFIYIRLRRCFVLYMNCTLLKRVKRSNHPSLIGWSGSKASQSLSFLYFAWMV